MTAVSLSSRPPDQGRWPTMFAALAEPNFRTYLFGMLFAYVPMTAQGVVQGYLAFDISGQASAIGAVTIASGITQVSMTLVAGALCDRYSRQRILMASQASLATLLAITAALIHLGIIEIWHLTVISALTGFVFSFNVPSRQGLLPDVVSAERLTNAVGLNNSGVNLCRIAGPSVAGALIAVPAIGLAGVYDLMAICYFAACLLQLRVHIPKRERAASNVSIGEAIVSGFRHITSSPVLRVLLMMAFIPIVLGMPYQTLMPVFAVRVMDVGSVGLGTMMSAIGIGALVGSLSVAALATSPHKATIQVGAAIGFGLALTLFALCQNYVLALLLLPFVGGLANVYMSLNNTLMMVHSDREYLGRVLSIYMLTWSMTPISTLPISAAVDHFGAPATVAVLGVIIAILVAFVGLANPRYRET